MSDEAPETTLHGKFCRWVSDTFMIFPFFDSERNCFVEAQTHWMWLAWQAATERMQAAGWRQCAEGQRVTQFCGMVEEYAEKTRNAVARAEAAEAECKRLGFEYSEIRRLFEKALDREKRLRGYIDAIRRHLPDNAHEAKELVRDALKEE